MTFVRLQQNQCSLSVLVVSDPEVLKNWLGELCINGASCSPRDWDN